MFSSTFIFSKRQFDRDFYRLDEAIAQAANSTPGYLGEESWESPANGLVSTVYYWDSMDSLLQLMKHPKHIEAKSKQDQWLSGYQVVISQVIRMYGDSKLAGVLPVTRVA
jgi:heme-degrading monooxygenase HmoA